MNAPFDPLRAGFAPRAGARVLEAAPARRRIRALAILFLAAFAVLGARAVQLALSEPPSRAAAAPAQAITQRADLVDRNGVLLAATLPSWTLAANPREVWDAPDVARRLAEALPGLDRAATERRLADTSRQLVYLRRGLTERQRAQIFALGLPGVVFEADRRRVYPHGALAAHALGHTDSAFAGVAGAEQGLQPAILRAGAAGRPVALSLDVRVQHALEAELAAGIARTQAAGAAGIVLNGRTGEVLAIASLPDFDPNAPPPLEAPNRAARATGVLYEMGSTLKPFTAIAALEAGLVRPGETWAARDPVRVGALSVRDIAPSPTPIDLDEALARSSNIVAADLARRLTAPRLREAYARAGLLARSSLQTPEVQTPFSPRAEDPISTAVLGYGHGIATTLVSLAGAYTVFCNAGARVEPTLLAYADGDEIERTPAFAPAPTRAVLAMMRRAAVTGTARLAQTPGLDVAAKTGTAEKPGRGGYDPDRRLSSIAAVFPAQQPAFVVVLALDEPKATAEAGGQATGGAVAAPILAKLLARIAPMLDLPQNGAGAPSPPAPGGAP